ncbi:MAG TPA: SDR family oxidoreductase [Nitrososphaerales archaeon]|nr:SDR family oxidoreductase [Nitrososphaerales archaeon]
MKVLVTGGAGFIGSHLVDGLVSSGHEVGVLDDFTTGAESNLAGHLGSVNLHRGSVTDEEFVRSTVKGYEAILHQAARVSVTRSVEDPLSTNRVNADGTLNLLVAAVDSGVEKFVFASSSSVYGDTPILPKVETMPPRPISPYAVSKLAAENYCRVFASVYGLSTVSLRYFNVYGPRQRVGQYSGVIPAFTKKSLAGEPPIIFGDGTQTRDFTFVKDVVQANILSLEKKVKGGEVFNVGSHEQISLNQLAKMICGLAGKSDLKPVNESPRPGDIAHSYADISKISKILGYKPSYTIESGLKQVVQWFRVSYPRDKIPRVSA